MGNTFFYIVHSYIPKEFDDAFTAWYDGTHMPEVAKASGCLTARRFRAAQTDDKYLYMVIYEFADMDAFLNYENSEARKALIADFRKNFGGKAETKKSTWELVYQTE